MVQPVSIVVSRANIEARGCTSLLLLIDLGRIRSGMYNLFVTNKFSLEVMINLRGYVRTFICNVTLCTKNIMEGNRIVYVPESLCKIYRNNYTGLVGYLKVQERIHCIQSICTGISTTSQPGTSRGAYSDSSVTNNPESAPTRP